MQILSISVPITFVFWEFDKVYGELVHEKTEPVRIDLASFHLLCARVKHETHNNLYVSFYVVGEIDLDTMESLKSAISTQVVSSPCVNADERSALEGEVIDIITKHSLGEEI